MSDWISPVIVSCTLESIKEVNMGYFRILAAIPGFFLSSFFLMLLWGVIVPHFGIADIDYPMAMLINITIWLAVAPLAAAGGHRWWHH